MKLAHWFQGFFDPGGEEALAAAVRAVEAVSSAEIVVAVRRSAGSYRDAHVLVGALCGALTLAFGLFSPWPFANVSLFVDPVLVGLAAGVITPHVPVLSRAVTSRKARDGRVSTHARALFVERGVGATRGRTGVLIYVSLLERTARVIADTGVTAAVPAPAWHEHTAALEAAAHLSKATAVARAITAIATTLARHLPASADDVNELSDEVVGP